MGEKPWMKFFPLDWRGDPRLRMCSLAARGLWIDIMSYMHEAMPYGHFLIDNKMPDLADMCALTGRPKAEVRRALEELESHGVFSRADNGAIYSRRMVRDKARAELDRLNGKGGGNPKLSAEVNPGVKPGVNPPDKAHMPEARGQRPEKKDRARGARLALDWQPSSDDLNFATSLGISGGRVSEETAKFRDYWHARAGPGAIKLDWSATWRNWCRKAVENGGRTETTETDRERRKRESREALAKLSAFGESRNDGDICAPVVRLLPRTGVGGEPGSVLSGSGGPVLQLPRGASEESG